MIFFNLVSAITTEYAVYVLARFLVGFFVAGNILSIVVLMSEIVGASWRGLYMMLAMGSFPVGIIALSVLASRVQEWRLLTALVSLLGVPFLFCHWYLIESPRWYLSQARTLEAEAVLHYIARGNGHTSKLDINLKPTPTCSPKARDALSMLLTRRRLSGTTLILFYVWFVNGASYYGLTLAAGALGTNIYTGTALSGTVELPAIVLTYLGIENLGRRSSLAGLCWSVGLAALPSRWSTVVGPMRLLPPPSPSLARCASQPPSRSPTSSPARCLLPASATLPWASCRGLPESELFLHPS